MNCAYCGKLFSKRHKVTDICLKCKHQKERGRAIFRKDPVEFAASAQKIVKQSDNPLLDWIDKKI